MKEWSKPTMDTKNNGNKKPFFFLAAAVVLGGISVAVYLAHSLRTVVTDDAYIEGRIHTISSKIPGSVKEVKVIDNQSVKKGDCLVEIDPVDFQVKVNEAQAALDAEKARLLDAEAGIKVAAAHLQMQEVSFDQAERDKQRSDVLYKENVIPQERQEKVLTAYALASASVKSAKDQLEKATSARDLEGSLIKQREAVLKTAELNLGYTKISAPSDGYVTRKSVESGNQVQAGQPLMAVTALDDIWVVANYKETQLKNVKRGQRVRIKVDTYPGRVFTGTVESIMAGTGAVFSLFPAENALGNYVKVVQRIPVKIVFDKSTDERHVLRIGMSCVPTVITQDE
jgi:membrane fusion protein, multidrug efflux system